MHQETRPKSARWLVRVACVLAAFLLAATSAVASAQSTGSSAGGGSWGSSSSSSSSGGWSSSSSSSSDYGSSTSGGTGSSYEPPMWAQALIAIAFLIFLFFFFKAFFWFIRPLPVDVSMVQVAVDARARRFVQEALELNAKLADTATREGLVKLLTASTGALTAARLAWMYAGSKSSEPMPFAQAHAAHTKLAVEARAGFQTELLRAADGRIETQETPDIVAEPHEGEGLVLVTLIVAAFGSLPDIDPARAEQVEELLSHLAGLTAKKLIAIEVVWTPSAENDRMSSDELESNYPTLTRLGDVGGRVFCSYCAGPHTAELPKCPHCGAPTESASGESATARADVELPPD